MNHVRIFRPEPKSGRDSYWVVLFRETEKPQVYYADSADEAERLAARIAAEHRCPWKYMPDFPELPHWFDENGDLRSINRVELIHILDGVIQINCWSDHVRLSTETGQIEDLLEDVRVLTEDWK